MISFRKRRVQIFIFCFSAFFWISMSIASEAKLLVVGTTEHEALLAREVGGDFIDVRWIVGADIDPHSIEPDQSFVPILRQADLLLVNGQGIEAGWLESLLKKAGNKSIMPGRERYITLSEGVTLLPYAAEELQGSKFQEIVPEKDVHQVIWNHHYWLDPSNEIPMIENIKKALIRIDPVNSNKYESNAVELISKLKEKINEWDASMAPFKGKRLIVYHRDWTYLAQRHGLEIVGYIEPKEMTRPRQEDFKNLANRYKNQNVSIVLLSGTQRPPFVDVDRVLELGVKIHAHTVILPESMNPSEKRGEIIAYFDHIYKVLTAILK